MLSEHKTLGLHALPNSTRLFSRHQYRVVMHAFADLYCSVLEYKWFRFEMPAETSTTELKAINAL